MWMSLRELTLSSVPEAERVAIGKYGKWLRCTRCHLVVYNQQVREQQRASYNGNIEASQASDVGSIPIARSKRSPCIYKHI